MDWLKLIISILMCQFAGLFGTIFTRKNIPTWFANLKKPIFNPPDWVFGPVWITLYFMMGISFYLIWKNENSSVTKIPIIIFIVHLFLNSIWTIIFFGFKSPGFAFIEIIILWILILICIIQFYPISTTASVLLIPYLLWVSFASVLNFTIWKLN
jgi:translocator protein